EGASLAYQQVLEDPELEAQAYKGLAWVEFNLGEYDLAKTYFQDSIRLGIDPPFNLGDSYNGLGWVYLRLGECEEAFPYFEQSLEINPEFQDSLRGVDTCRGLMQPD
ncbi:MAG: tetratricopeptide repeat protein, partial [Chloroflexi bacterium]|nr:tetratricopeptide repeat protein [Chloroflexota bacterium]